MISFDPHNKQHLIFILNFYKKYILNDLKFNHHNLIDEFINQNPKTALVYFNISTIDYFKQFIKDAHYEKTKHHHDLQIDIEDYDLQELANCVYVIIDKNDPTQIKFTNQIAGFKLMLLTAQPDYVQVLVNFINHYYPQFDQQFQHLNN